MTKIILLAALLTASPAHALTGEELYGYMHDESPTVKLAAFSYVRGLLDGSDIARTVYGAKPRDKDDPAFCPPETAGTSHAVDIINRYLAALPPEYRRLDAGILSSYALAKAWPCRRALGG